MTRISSAAAATPETAAAISAVAVTAGPFRKHCALHLFRKRHHLFSGNFTRESRSQKLFYIRQIIAAVFTQKTDGGSTVSGTARAPDTVDVIL